MNLLNAVLTLREYCIFLVLFFAFYNLFRTLIKIMMERRLGVPLKDSWLDENAPKFGWIALGVSIVLTIIARLLGG